MFLITTLLVLALAPVTCIKQRHISHRRTSSPNDLCKWWQCS